MNIKRTMLLAAVILDKTSLQLSAKNRNTITQFIAGYYNANAEMVTETSKIISNHESE